MSIVDGEDEGEVEPVDVGAVVVPVVTTWVPVEEVDVDFLRMNRM
jgi:hypothetical protein